jgi:hypothetical protein
MEKTNMEAWNLMFDESANKFVAVNPNTGEVKDLIPATAAKPKKAKKGESSEPQLILADNKYTLNTAAVELMGVEPEAKLNIKFRKIDKVQTPVLGTDEAFKCKSGNRLTKSFTVACRGANHDALAAYGTVFTLEATEDGTFILKGDKTPEPVESDDNLVEDVDLPEGLSENLDQLNDDIPEDAEEIDGDDFQAMLASL